MRMHGHPVKTFSSGFVVNPGYPFLGALPDGKVIDSSEENAFGIIEIKCPYKHGAVTPETACNQVTIVFTLNLNMTFQPLRKTTNITPGSGDRWA